jgi:hypothetical protein
MGVRRFAGALWAAPLVLVAVVAPPALTASASASAGFAASATGKGHWHGESVLEQVSYRRELTAVSCAGGARPRCVGLGGRTDPRGNDSSYSEVGNGRSWHVVYTAHPHGVNGLEPSGQTGYELDDVSCTAPQRCIAVGEFFRHPAHERPLSERWNGHSWTVLEPSGQGTPAELDHLSCATASRCMAVGSTVPASPLERHPVVELWDGSHWSITHPPLPARPGLVTVTSVSCPTATSCTVVGEANDTQDPPRFTAFADTWAHGAWTVDELPDSTGDALSVDCVSAAACMMIVTQSWSPDTPNPVSYSLSGHGASWTRTTLPDVLQGASLACRSATSCFVAGDVEMASWSGTSWTQISAASGLELFDISCPSAALCVLPSRIEPFLSGGLHDAAKWGFATYTDRSTFRFHHVPAPVASNGGDLSAVSCPTNTMCMAVRSPDGAIEREQGGVWRISRPPSGQDLESISCVSPTWCMAVGAEHMYDNHHPSVTVRWNGHRWRRIPSPPVEPHVVELTSVSCTSPTFCLAIDDHNRWAQRWDGHRWHPTRRPDQKSAGLTTNLSCINSHLCVVGGYVGINNQSERPASEIWRGSHWRLITAIHPAVPRKQIPQLDSVSCLSATFCLALGSFVPGVTGYARVFAERWNGRVWRETRHLAGIAARRDADEAVQPVQDVVSCVSRTRCVATLRNPAQTRSISSMWNGETWTRHPSPTALPLGALSCATRTCTAAGVSPLGEGTAYRLNW